jgi:2-hydroxychromene-2-carboxylate isomerase
MTGLRALRPHVMRVLRGKIMPRQVDYYFSLISPWSYLGHGEFVAVARKHDVTIQYNPVRLPELFPQSGGLPLAKRHPLRQQYRMMELQRWREKRQMPMQLRPKFWPFDSALGDRVVIALAAGGLRVENFLPLAFAATFEKEQDLADEKVLADLLMSAGFDAPAILQQAKSESCAEIYSANLQKAIDSAAFGAPTYVLNGEVFWGQDRIDFLDAALKTGRKAFHADV